MTTLAEIVLPDRDDALELAWPTDGRAGAFLRFDKPSDWRAFIEGLAIDASIPQIVRAKFYRAQILYLLGWQDVGLIKAGELAALVALELALTDRYGGKVVSRKRSFAGLLEHLVLVDGLTDTDIPMVTRCGGTAVGQLIGETRPTLAERRNALAHGDPFEGPPTGGLLELVRDLINFAYRDYRTEAAAVSEIPLSLSIPTSAPLDYRSGLKGRAAG
jgi:hypothetical protein